MSLKIESKMINNVLKNFVSLREVYKLIHQFNNIIKIIKLIVTKFIIKTYRYLNY